MTDMTPRNTTPNPGSQEAADLGCKCPRIDNAHGRGTWGTCDLPQESKVFVRRQDCPMHGWEDAKEGK